MVNAVWMRAMGYLEDILNVVPAAVFAGAVYLLLRLLQAAAPKLTARCRDT